MEGLPPSHGYNSILFVVDMFSKFSHFVALKHQFTALSVTKLLMTNIYRLHGMPKALVSDRDKIFTNVWRHIFDVLQMLHQQSGLTISTSPSSSITLPGTLPISRPRSLCYMVSLQDSLVFMHHRLVLCHLWMSGCSRSLRCRP